MSERPKDPPDRPMDVLSEVLASLRLRSAFYGCLSLGPAGELANEVTDGAVFHHIESGEVRLELNDATPMKIGAGEVIMIPQGGAYVLRGDATLVSGCFHFDDAATNPLLRALPRLIRISAARLPWMQSTLEQIAAESAAPSMGSEAVICRLSDILFVQLVRAHFLGERSESGWLRALADPHLGAALASLHAHPERSWTVASLAGEAGLSRSMFAERFAAMTGETPKQYLTRWRMQKAVTLLRDGHETLASIAVRIGYESEASFGKAFKRWFDVAPGAYRSSAAGSARSTTR